MNFVRILAPALSLALVAPLGGCGKQKIPGTTPPGSDVAAVDPGNPDTPAASADGKPGKNDAPPVAEDPTKKKCEAKVADTPAALFEDKVMIRPPINVELVEETPSFATTYAKFVSTCDATVDRMNLFVFENDKKKGVDKYMEEMINDFLPKNGYSGGKRGEDYVSSKVRMDTSVEYPPGKGAPAAVLYISVKKLYSFTLVAIYQTRPPEFNALQKTFTASAESLLVLPPDA